MYCIPQKLKSDQQEQQEQQQQTYVKDPEQECLRSIKRAHQRSLLCIETLLAIGNLMRFIVYTTCMYIIPHQGNQLVKSKNRLNCFSACNWFVSA